MPQSPTTLPRNWPKEITYLTTLHIPAPLTPTVLRISSSSGAPPLQLPIVRQPHSPSPLVRITPITLRSHPANGQHGLLATKPLPPDTLILLYLGVLHPSSTTDPDSNYDLSVDRDLDLSIDASRSGNEARFINDYRGIRPDGPNAEFRDCLVESRPRIWERRIGVFVLGAGKAGGKRAKGIAKGEEIVVSYGKGFWNARKCEGDGDSEAAGKADALGRQQRD